MYEKQHFVKGQILKAEHLNHIEDGIYNAEQNSVRADIAQNLSEAQKATARENIGAVSAESMNNAIRALDEKMKSTSKADKAYHLGFYLDANGDLSYD